MPDTPSPAPASLAALREAEAEARHAAMDTFDAIPMGTMLSGRRLRRWESMASSLAAYRDAVAARVRAEMLAERQQTFEAAHVTVLPEGDRG